MRNSLSIAAMAAFVAGGPVPALAHPHVWVTVTTEILYAPDQTITGLRHKWTFDEMYSAFAVQGLDKDGDGKYSREELQPLAQVNIEALKPFGLYTYPKLGEKLLERKDAADYWLEFADGSLSLHLTLPLVDPVPADKVKDFTFGVYDPTFYVAFSYAEETPVRLAGGAPDACAAKVAPPEPKPMKQVSLSEAFYESLDAQSGFGAQFASTISIECGGR